MGPPRMRPMNKKERFALPAEKKLLYRNQTVDDIKQPTCNVRTLLRRPLLFLPEYSTVQYSTAQ